MISRDLQRFSEISLLLVGKLLVPNVCFIADWPADLSASLGGGREFEGQTLTTSKEGVGLREGRRTESRVSNRFTCV